MKARWKSALRIVLAALFAAQFVVLDVAFDELHAPWSRLGARGVLESVAIWGALFVLSLAGRAARLVVAFVAASLLVFQTFVYRVVHVPFDVQVAESALHSFGVIRPALSKALPAMAITIAVATLVELALLEVARLRVSRRGQWAVFVGATVAVAVGPAPRSSTPDVRAVHALSVLRHEPPKPIAGAVALAPLHSTRSEMPDVLFVLTESVRATEYVLRGPEATAAATADATPGRFELDQLRSISSYTAVSLSALITGRSQEGNREDILRAPNLFDFAHAAQADVAFYSAQSRETFETKDVSAAVDHMVTLETFAGHPVEDDSEWVVKPLDRMIVDRFVADLPTRRHPSATVLQLYGTHAPYYFEDEKAKFTPFARAVGWSKMPDLRNAYRNAIVEQDTHVARAIRAFIARAGRRPWLVVFTSDHGEAFGEHGAIHHGQNLYDEQVRVPGWIAAGNGALTEEEKHALAEHRERFVTHLDLLPTMLDALGLLTNFSVQGHVGRFAGHSLLRGYVSHAPIPVTNCTGMFPCPLNTWGLLAGDHKLVAQVWDANWKCLSAGGGEHLAAPDDPVCATLSEASRQSFPLLPSGTPNR